MSNLKSIMVEISKLKPFDKNPRKITEQELKKLENSILKFGFVEPIVINKDFTIIGGHQRVQAAKQLGMTELPAIQVDLSKDDEISLNLALNKIAGTWDELLLANILKELKEHNFDLNLTGFDLKEISVALDLLINPSDKDDKIPENISSTTKSGDIWQLGDHRLCCGDSTKKEDVEKLMQVTNAELLFTSPPYSDMREYEGNQNLEIDHLTNFIQQFYPFVNYQMINLGIQRKNGEIYEYWNQYIKKARDTGYKLLSWNIWEKDTAGSIGNQSAFFPIEHEWIFVFGKNFKDINRTEKRDSKKKIGYNKHRNKDGSMQIHKIGLQMDRKEMSTIIYVPSVKNEGSKHPAMFPCELAEKYITVMTNQSDIVVDCFGGAGSTLIACEKLNRKCYMMELSPHYCDIIIQRWQEFTGKKAEKVI